MISFFRQSGSSNYLEWAHHSVFTTHTHTCPHTQCASMPVQHNLPIFILNHTATEVESKPKKINVIRREDIKLSLVFLGPKQAVFFRFGSFLISPTGEPGCGWLNLNILIIFHFSSHCYFAAHVDRTSARAFPPLRPSCSINHSISAQAQHKQGIPSAFADIIKRYMVRNAERIFTNKSVL